MSEDVKLNADQESAIQIMHGFLGSSTEQFMVLEGAGGTGKTFVLKHFVRTLHDFHKTRRLLGLKGKTGLPINFTATTNNCTADCSPLEAFGCPHGGSFHSFIEVASLYASHNTS